MALAALDLLTAVVADRTAHLGTFDRLAVDAGSTGRFRATFLRANLTPEPSDEFLPRAVLLPRNKVIPNGALGEKVMGKIVPLAAGSSLILDGVDHFAKVYLPRAAGWLARGEEILDHVPLLVRQVGAVRFSHGFPALGKSLVLFP